MSKTFPITDSMSEVAGWGGKFLLGNNHTYWWKETPASEPRPLSGVTSVLNVIAKPALIPWAVKLAVEAMTNGATPEQAKRAHLQKTNYAADLGTDAHALIEDYIMQSIEKNGGIPMPATSTVARVNEFALWAVQRNAETEFKFLCAEDPLADGKLALAGTPDFVGTEKREEGEVIVIGDLKTGSGIYDRTYFAQMAAYGYMYVRHHKIPKSKIHLVIAHAPSQKPDQPMATYWSQDWEGDWKGFMAALYLHRWKDNFVKKPNF